MVHGSTSTYVNRRCRCVECRQSWAQYQRDYRERREPWRVAWRLAREQWRAECAVPPHPGEGEYVGRGIDEMAKEMGQQGLVVDRAINRAKRHTRRAASVGRLTSDEWLDLVAKYDGRCAYCGTMPDVLHADHRTPLSRGGTNTIDNILPACGPCNAHKYTKTEAEFRAWR